MAAKKPKPTSKKTQRRLDWGPAFLAHLSQTGNFLRSCQAASIDRTTARVREKADADFRAAVIIAYQEAADLLEEEARRRAVQGVERHLLHKGEVVFVWVDAAGAVVPEGTGVRQVPLIERKYSDRLLSQLLAACNRKKFGRRVHHKHKVAGDVKLRVVEEIIDGNKQP